MTMNPKEFLKKNIDYLKALEKSKEQVVKVGLPQEKVGGEIYSGDADGLTIIQNGAIHEFGAGVPKRSFLDLPFKVKAPKIEATIRDQFKQVAEDGKDPKKALGLIGVQATNISKEAFTTTGFGKWKPSQKEGQTLIDTGTLRGSITWVVANAS